MSTEFWRDFAAFARKWNYVPSTSPQEVIAATRLNPEEVIDVGVRNGTPFLYKSFPSSSFILVDPQQGGENELIYKPERFTFLNVGVGSNREPRILHEFPDKGMSSILSRASLTKDKITKSYNIEMTTLDDIIENHCATKNIGIKLDIEGFEVDAIKGLNSQRERVKFIISECSVKRRFKNSYNFSELCSAFLDHGFVFYNFLNPATRLAPNFYDCLFLPENDPLFE